MKSSNVISAIIVKMIVIFNVNNNCHKQHTQNPFSCASDISFSNNNRRFSSAGGRSVDSFADGGRCYIIRRISVNDSFLFRLAS
jgi:hypothetical protein